MTTTHAPPGAPGTDCRCSPLLNTYGAGLRATPCDLPVTAEWFIAPDCPVHQLPAQRQPEATDVGGAT